MPPTNKPKDKDSPYDLRKKSSVPTPKTVKSINMPVNKGTPHSQSSSSLISSSNPEFDPMSPSKLSVLEKFYQIAAPSAPDLNFICCICKESITNNLEHQASKVADINKDLEENIRKVSLLSCHVQNFLLKSDSLQKELNRVNNLEEKLAHHENDVMKTLNDLKLDVELLSTKYSTPLPSQNDNTLESDVMKALNELKANVEFLSDKPATPPLNQKTLEIISDKIDLLTNITSDHVIKNVSLSQRKSTSTSNPIETHDTQHAPPCEPYCNTLDNFLPDDQLKELHGYLETLDLEDLGSREVQYYGTHRYKYGKTSHDPVKPSPIIQNIMDKINSLDADNPINSCLVTKYVSPDSFCPPHSDNEPSLSPVAPIHTLSVGSPRVMKFTSIRTHQTTDTTLNPNSLLTFSRKSQSYYRHEILKGSLTGHHGVRYSLTFRDIKPSYSNYSVIIGDSNTKGIKFGAGEGFLGVWMPGQHVPAARIAHIPSADALPPARNFFIHCGLNDIKDPHHPAHPSDLANQLESKCADIHRLYPTSKIYLSPVLPTMNYHLNEAIMNFNDFLLQDLPNKHHNLFTLRNINFFNFTTGLLKFELKGNDAIHINRKGIAQLAMNFKNCVIRKAPVHGLNFSGALKYGQVVDNSIRVTNMKPLIRPVSNVKGTEGVGVIEGGVVGMGREVEQVGDYPVLPPPIILQDDA